VTRRDRDTNRFVSRHDVHQLYEIVREVCRHANPAQPETVSQRLFDASRAAGGHPTAPTAKAIADRLGYPWPELLSLVFDDSRSAEHAVAIRGRRQGRQELTEAEIAWALKLVATHLAAKPGVKGADQDGEPSIRPSEYSAGWEALVEQDRRSWLHGGRLARTLPTVDQIEYSLRRKGLTWDDGLLLAGLAVRQRTASPTGMAATAVIELFIEDMGCVPNTEQLRQYAKAKKLSLANYEGGLGPQLRAVRKARRERGLSTPRPCGAGKLEYDHVQPLGEDQGVRRRRREWDWDEAIDGLVLALEEMKGKTLTQRALGRLAKQNSAIPAPSLVGRMAKQHGLNGLVDMRAEAAKRLAAKRQTARSA
jgi:hypothetical protein